MISGFDLSGFKCFPEIQELRVAKLTLLAGLNSAGKSTVLQPILLLSQAMRTVMNPRAIPLNGELVQLGAAGDVFSRGKSSVIKLNLHLENSSSLNYELTSQAGHRFVYRMNVEGDENSYPDMHESAAIDESGLRDLIYISVARPGLSGIYPWYDRGVDLFDVGIDGRFAAYWYNSRSDDEVPVERRNAREDASTFRKQVDAWLSELFGESRVNIQAVANHAVVGGQFGMSPESGWQHPANVGYGVSYAFPIVIALLGARDGQVVIVDSPEAHLHPSAQSAMGRMLAKFSEAGVQIIVETHSDHLLNGVRLAVKEKVILHQHVSMAFVRRGDGVSVIDGISLDEKGRISNWPRGFFDQIEQDLARL